MLHHRYLTGFWICLGFLFWINQSSEYAGVTQNICLNNFWTCQNISKYVWMCRNLLEWLLFYFLIVIPCLLECMVTYFIVYMKLDFFYGSWKNLICFFVWLNIFIPSNDVPQVLLSLRKALGIILKLSLFYMVQLFYNNSRHV